MKPQATRRAPFTFPTPEVFDDENRLTRYLWRTLYVIVGSALCIAILYGVAVTFFGSNP